jgi:hypothetical protein
MEYVATITLDHAADSGDADALLDAFLAAHAEASPVVGEDLQAGTIDVSFAVEAQDGYEAFERARRVRLQPIEESAPGRLLIAELGGVEPGGSDSAGAPFLSGLTSSVVASQAAGGAAAAGADGAPYPRLSEIPRLGATIEATYRGQTMAPWQRNVTASPSATSNASLRLEYLPFRIWRMWLPGSTGTSVV